MPCNFAAESVHTKKLYSRLSSREVHFTGKWSIFVFEPLSGGLGATYAVLLRFIGKLVVEVLLVIIELFFANIDCF